MVIMMMVIAHYQRVGFTLWMSGERDAGCTWAQGQPALPTEDDMRFRV